MTIPESHTPPADQPDIDPSVRSKAQEATMRVLDAGMLPHSTSERDHAAALMGPAFTITGGKGYAERIVRLNAQHAIIDVPPQLTLGSQLGFEDPSVTLQRKQAEQAHNEGVMATVADHMIGYVDDATQVIDDLMTLEEAIQVLDGADSLNPVLHNPQPPIARALAALTRLHETQQYVAQPGSKTPLNADLNDFDDPAVAERVNDATRYLMIGELRREIATLIQLEYGRLCFWYEQLVGRPERPAQGDKSDEDYVPPVRRRHGLIETNNQRIHDTIADRMFAIATKYFSDKD